MALKEVKVSNSERNACNRRSSGQVTYILPKCLTHSTCFINICWMSVASVYYYKLRGARSGSLSEQLQSCVRKSKCLLLRADGCLLPCKHRHVKGLQGRSVLPGFWLSAVKSGSVTSHPSFTFASVWFTSSGFLALFSWIYMTQSYVSLVFHV